MAKFIEMQPQTREHLFARGAKPISDFRESWNLACQRAGVPGLLFHDLRRSAVRNLRRAGVAETVIMKITGHRTRSVFERYNITDHTDTLEAGRKAAGFLAKEQEVVAQITSRKPERPNGKEEGKFFVLCMVRRGGLEPPRCYPLAPQASASANSAISALRRPTS
jgi:hypothetical protein